MFSLMLTTRTSAVFKQDIERTKKTVKKYSNKKITSNVTFQNFICIRIFTVFEHSNPVFLKSFFTLNGSNFATFNCITNCC